MQKNAGDKSKGAGASHWWLSVGRSTLQSMTTTQLPHPLISAAEGVICGAADLLEVDGFRRRSGSKPPYGLPEALAEAAGVDAVALVIAERQCVQHGLDVWWNDLLCVDGDDAAAQLRALVPIDPAVLYGAMWDANLGLLQLSFMLTPAQLNGISNMVTQDQWKLFESCLELARFLERESMLSHLCEDIAFSVSHHATTPAGVSRRLRAVRGLECVAAHHVLMDALSLEDKAILVAPVAAILPLHVDV